MSNEYEQPVEPMSRTEDLLRTGTEEPVIAMSEIEKILRGEHIDRPHSRVADLLLQYNPSDILIEKRIEENGTYYATADAADGYYKVVVDTPVIPPTVLEHLVETVSTNGTHTFTPGTGVDGFSDASITVNVAPNVGSKNITQNGNYAASSDNLDGYSNVNVNVAPNVGSKNIIENGTYNASSDNLDGYSQVVVDVPPEPITEARSVENLPQPIASFNNGAEAPITSLKVAIEPVQEGSGDPSPTNIRPISGWDEAVVNDNGINLCDIGSASFTRYKQYPLLLPAGTYTISSLITSTDIDDNDCYFGIYGSNNNLIASSRLNRNTRVSHTFTLDVKSSHIILYAGHNSSQSVGDDATWADIQIEIGTKATAYTSYNGQTNTIDLGGTHYGGEVDVVNGGGTDKLGYVDLSTLNWQTAGNGIFNAVVTNLKPNTSAENIPNIMCDIYNPQTPIAVYNKTADGIITLGTSGYWGDNKVAVYDSRYSDAPTFQTAMSGHQLVYELATPITYDTQPTPINSLKGDNNVYANTGNINDLDYIYVNDNVGTLINKSITANGSYCAVTDDNADGYLNIDVSVSPNVGTKSITSNGTYNASSDSLDGYSQVTVNTPSPKAPTGYNRIFREASMEFQFDPNGKIKSVYDGSGGSIGGTIQGVSDLNGSITSLHITGSITDSYEYNNKTGFERCQFIVGFTDQRWDSTILVGYNDYGSAYIKEEITLTNQQEVNDIDISIDLTDQQYEQYASTPKYFFISLLGISGEFDVTLE